MNQIPFSPDSYSDKSFDNPFAFMCGNRFCKGFGVRLQFLQEVFCRHILFCWRAYSIRDAAERQSFNPRGFVNPG